MGKYQDLYEGLMAEGKVVFKGDSLNSGVKRAIETHAKKYKHGTVKVKVNENMVEVFFEEPSIGRGVMTKIGGRNTGSGDLLDTAKADSANIIKNIQKDIMKLKLDIWDEDVEDYYMFMVGDDLVG